MTCNSAYNLLTMHELQVGITGLPGLRQSALELRQRHGTSVQGFFLPQPLRARAMSFTPTMRRAVSASGPDRTRCRVPDPWCAAADRPSPRTPPLARPPYRAPSPTRFPPCIPPSLEVPVHERPAPARAPR